MTNYITTRTFPGDLTGRVGDLIPAWCRSAKISHFEDVGLASITAHRSEINAVRSAISLAQAEARIDALERNASPLRRVNLDGCDLRFVDMAKARSVQ